MPTCSNYPASIALSHSSQYRFLVSMLAELFYLLTLNNLATQFACFAPFLPRRYASAVYAMGLCLSVCPSVRLSVRSQCSTKTDKLRIEQTTPLDCTETLVFWRQKSRNSTAVNPCWGAKCRWGGLKSETFDKWLAISRKRYRIDAQFLLKSNRKSHAFYRTVTLPMTLSGP